MCGGSHISCYYVLYICGHSVFNPTSGFMCCWFCFDRCALSLCIAGLYLGDHIDVVALFCSGQGSGRKKYVDRFVVVTICHFACLCISLLSLSMCIRVKKDFW